MGKIYSCCRKTEERLNWDRVEAIRLTDVVDGGEAPLQTMVKACWDENNFYVRFICEDDFIVATMTERDDPIYKEDVVEVFIDEIGSGRNYMEFEFSPANVIFDALIENDLNGRITVNQAWNAEGLQSSVNRTKDGLIYDIVIPTSIFQKKPVSGCQYRINFYRIDQAPEGKRRYWAWSPTGKVNFHTPQSFGTILLG